MKILKNKKIVIYTLVGFVVLQAAVVGYSMVGRNLLGLGSSSETTTEENTSDEAVSSQITKTSQTVNLDIIQADDTTTNTDISQEIQDIIKQSDPDNFDKNLSNYKKFLTDLNVHVIFKQDIELQIRNGKKVNDVLIAYEFIYDRYGTIKEFESMLNDKTNGKSWSDIFREYKTMNTEFTPSSFNTDYLRTLLNTDGLNKNDIMIADRVSKKVENSFSEVISLRQSVINWKVVNASLGILNSQQQLPHLTITPEQIKNYSTTGLSQDKIVEGLMTAKKLRVDVSNIIEMEISGLSDEEIYAKSLEEKYY